jgi:hypothetical protein
MRNILLMMSILIGVMYGGSIQANAEDIEKTMEWKQKPVLCTSANNALEFIKNEYSEEPVMIWQNNDIQTIVFLNSKSGTATIIDVSRAGNACFLSTGKDVFHRKFKSE